MVGDNYNKIIHTTCCSTPMNQIFADQHYCYFDLSQQKPQSIKGNENNFIHLFSSRFTQNNAQIIRPPLVSMRYHRNHEDSGRKLFGENIFHSREFLSLRFFAPFPYLRGLKQFPRLVSIHMNSLDGANTKKNCETS